MLKKIKLLFIAIIAIIFTITLFSAVLFSQPFVSVNCDSPAEDDVSDYYEALIESDEDDIAEITDNGETDIEDIGNMEDGGEDEITEEGGEEEGGEEETIEDGVEEDSGEETTEESGEEEGGEEEITEDDEEEDSQEEDGIIGDAGEDAEEGFSGEDLIPEEIDEEEIEEDMLLMEPEELIEGSSISGFLWVDGDGSNPDTDWNGYYDAGELPLGGYTIYLFNADDLDTPIDSTKSDQYGNYIFTELEPGYYVAGLAPEIIDDIEYLLPTVVTAESVFAIDLDTDFTVYPFMAYSRTIEITTDTVVQNISAGLHLPRVIEQHFDGTIDLSETLLSTDNYIISGYANPGYSVLSGNGLNDRDMKNDATGILTFTAKASGKTFEIIQSGKRLTPPDPNAPKQGTSLFRGITVAQGAGNITLIIEDIDLPCVKTNFEGYFYASVNVGSGNNLTLLLNGVNYLRNRIQVPEGALITIESLNNNNSVDHLKMPALPQRGSEQSDATSTDLGCARIGGYIGNPAGKITIDGGSIDIITRPLSTGAAIGGGGYNRTDAYGQTGNGGEITINGGLISIAASSTGAGIGGGGCNYTPATSFGYGGNGGEITINGGTVEVSQIGVLGYPGNGYSGAGIGGGGGAIGNGGNGGTISIIDGTVNVTQYTRAAGIGGGLFGGSGNITIEDGRVGVEVIHNGIQTGEGAAIGSSSGTNASGYGYITINGGMVTAITSSLGGAGIGIANGGQPCDITITGGTVYARGGLSPGIGLLTGDALGLSRITITGGKVVALSASNAAIGGRTDKNGIINAEPFFCLGAGADIKAYSGSNDHPAINAKENEGNGYFVNANLNTTFPTEVTLSVIDDRTGEFVKSLSLPAGYPNFAYSSDLGESRTDNVFALDLSNFWRSIERVMDDSPQIYSINQKNEYNAHNGNSGKGVLPVKISGATYYEVTERYVDEFGVSLKGVNESKTFVSSSGGTYDKAGSYAIPGYAYKGYKWDYPPDSSGMDYLPGIPPSTPVSGGEIIYFVYEEAVFVPLTVSKTVEGRYGDKTRQFGFTIYFFDEEGYPLPAFTTFEYTGGILADSGASAPEDGTLTLEEGGWAAFVLKHGQTITIEEVSAKGKIQIVEETVSFYATFFKDSEEDNPENGEDTDVREMSDAPRFFDFTNSVDTVVESGVGAGYIGGILLLPSVAILLLGLGLAAKRVVFRRRAIRGVC